MDQLDERVWNTLDQDDDSFEALTAPLVGLRGKRIRRGDDKMTPHQGMVYDEAANSDDQEDWLGSKRSQDEFADLTLPYLVGSEVSKMDVKRTDDRIRPIDDRAADHCNDQTELGNKSPQEVLIIPGRPNLSGTDPNDDEDGRPLVKIKDDDQEQDDKCKEEDDRIEKEDDWNSNEAFEELTLSFVDYGRDPTETPGMILSDQVPDNDQGRMVQVPDNDQERMVRLVTIREQTAPDQTKETSPEDKLLKTATTRCTGAPPTNICDDDGQFEDRNSGAGQDDQEEPPVTDNEGRGIDDQRDRDQRIKDEEEFRKFHDNLGDGKTSTPEPSMGRKHLVSVDDDDDDQGAQGDSSKMIKCSFKKGGICHLHGPGATKRWKPVPLKTVGPDGKRFEKKYFYVCDLGARGRLRQTKLSFGLKTTQNEKTTSSITNEGELGFRDNSEGQSQDSV